jgi:hypothetical protein
MILQVLYGQYINLSFKYHKSDTSRFEKTSDIWGKKYPLWHSRFNSLQWIQLWSPNKYISTLYVQRLLSLLIYNTFLTRLGLILIYNCSLSQFRPSVLPSVRPSVLPDVTLFENNSSPKQFVPQTIRPQKNSSPKKFVPKQFVPQKIRPPNNSAPKQIGPKKIRPQKNSSPKQFGPQKIRPQTNSAPKNSTPKKKYKSQRSKVYTEALYVSAATSAMRDNWFWANGQIEPTNEGARSAL